MEFIFHYKRSDIETTIFEKKIYDSSSTGASLQFIIWKSKEEDRDGVTIEQVIRTGAQS